MYRLWHLQLSHLFLQSLYLIYGYRKHGVRCAKGEGWGL